MQKRQSQMGENPILGNTRNRIHAYKKDRSITAFFGAPKSSPGKPAKANATNGAASFDKATWVASLSEEQRELLALEINTLHDSWLPYLKDELMSSEFLNLKKFLKSEALAGKKIFPPSADVYSWYVNSESYYIKQIHLTLNLGRDIPHSTL
jgi:uracil-DNA glycosylase